MKRKALIVITFVVLGILGYLGFSNFSADTLPTTPTSNSAQPDTKKTFDKTKYSTSAPASIWVVSNKQRPLNPKNYAPADLATPSVATKGTQQLRSEAAQAAATMFASAKAQGISLRVDSAYRSYDRQVSVYGSEVKAYGQATADTQSARPGYSEHQTGLAADFGAASGKCSIADCFGTMPEGKWMAANAYKYGFIMRYTPDKQSVTGYRYEPWHFRYVGVELATEMHNKNIETLEEFFGLGAAPSY